MYIDIVQRFDDEDEIYFKSDTGCFIFSQVPSMSENTCIIKIKSCLTSEGKSIINVKIIDFSVITFSLFFNMFLSNLRHCLEYTIGRHKILLFSHCENFKKCENNRL